MFCGQRLGLNIAWAMFYDADMATPERPIAPKQPEDNAYLAQRALLNRQLELADEIENPVERFLTRDKLLEELDQLES